MVVTKPEPQLYTTPSVSNKEKSVSVSASSKNRVGYQISSKDGQNTAKRVSVVYVLNVKFRLIVDSKQAQMRKERGLLGKSEQA